MAMIKAMTKGLVLNVVPVNLSCTTTLDYQKPQALRTVAL
jgi:hypothetical protein